MAALIPAAAAVCAPGCTATVAAGATALVGASTVAAATAAAPMLAAGATALGLYQYMSGGGEEEEKTGDEDDRLNLIMEGDPIDSDAFEDAEEGETGGGPEKSPEKTENHVDTPEKTEKPVVLKKVGIKTMVRHQNRPEGTTGQTQDEAKVKAFF